MNERPEVDYCQYKKVDPFLSIPSALLNSADIERYANKTNMVYPFYAKDLKSSSYAVRMQGYCKWWDEKRKPQEIYLDGKKHKRFTLLPNSIAFIELEPKLTLPDYMAIRFNLRIKHIYRGLLLGTGPLIDPGFEGKVYIPLHNLTTNEYIFDFNEKLVWFEFTKTSPINIESHKETRYIDFPVDKKDIKLNEYLDKASDGKPIISSIPDAMKKSSDLAEQAKKSANRVKNVGYLAFGAWVLALLALLHPTWDMQQHYIDKVQALEIMIKDNSINHVKKSENEKNTLISMLLKDKANFTLSEKEALIQDITRLKDCIKKIKHNKETNRVGDDCEM